MAKRCDRARRSFLKGSGLTLAGFGLMSLLPGPLVRQALAAQANGKRLLFIFLRGGNDGLNAVIPRFDPDYSTANRPTLYIPPAQSIDLNGYAALHPALAELADVHATGRLAVIHRVGYPGSSHSHFDGQRIWENGDPSQPRMFEGWLYRFIRENAVAQGVALPVMTAQPNPPLLLRGDQSFVNVANPDEFDYLHLPPKRTKYSDAWRSRYAGVDGLEPYRSILSDTGIKLIDTLDTYRAWDQAAWDPRDPGSGDSLFPVSDATNPVDPSSATGLRFEVASYEFFKSLKLCALSMLESPETRIAGTELGGFDLHDDQGALNGDHSMLLSWLAYGIRSLSIALSGAAVDDRGYSSIWQDTVVTTMSEFGRTSKENNSGGTDHANASCMFMAGGAVQGGVYNCDPATWPAGVMFGINGRYLLERTDYRAVFWELLRDHMGADPAQVEAIFPGYTALGLNTQELGVI